MGMDLRPIPPFEDETDEAAHKWRPTVSDIVTVGAVLGAALMWFEPPNWQIGLPVVILTSAVVIFTAFRHKSHPFVRGTIGTIAVIALISVAWRPILDGFRKDYPTIVFQWPITIAPPSPRTSVSFAETFAMLGYHGRPIAWREYPFLSLLPSDQTKVLTFILDGINVEQDEVELNDAYVISGIDGTRLNLNVVFYGSPTDKARPVEINPLPSETMITLRPDYFNGLNGISESEFLQKWAIMNLVVEYKDGKKQRVSFDREHVTHTFSLTIPHPSLREPSRP
jgi:hypothetical protein